MNTYLISLFSIDSIVNSTSTIMRVIYWFGLLSCVYYGIQKSNNSPLPSIVHCIMNSLFGGLIRDTCVLYITPWLFSASAIPDLTFVCITCVILNIVDKYTQLLNTQNWKRIIWWIDAFSLSSFLTLGYDKAIDLGYHYIIAILSGYVTATTGGLLANFHNLQSSFNVKQLWYHIIVLLNCIIYSFIPNSCILLFSIPALLSIAEINFRSLYVYYFTDIPIEYSKSPLTRISTPTLRKTIFISKLLFKQYIFFMINYRKHIAIRRYNVQYSHGK